MRGDGKPCSNSSIPILSSARWRPAWSRAACLLAATAIFPDPKGPLRPVVFAITALLLLRYMSWRIAATLPPPGWSVDYGFRARRHSLGKLRLRRRAAVSAVPFAHARPQRDRRRERRLAAQRIRPSPGRRSHLLLQRRARDPRAHDRRRAGDGLSELPGMDARRQPARLAARALRRTWLPIFEPTHQRACEGREHQQRAWHSVGPRTASPTFVSILDADFVPTRGFLTRALSLFRDPKVALVQTPQHFINPDPIQINLRATNFWPDEQRMFFDCVMASKDAWGAAFCCGTSSIIRFEPLIADRRISDRFRDRGLSRHSCVSKKSAA